MSDVSLSQFGDYYPTMAASGHCYVEWKEQFVSKEKGNRVVHYYFKDISGESILAIVGTEKSLRHMFYVVSEEFLSVHGAGNSVQAGFRWRSRREVVHWLTSMLSKQHRQSDRSKSPKNDPATRVSGHQTEMPDYKGHVARNLKGPTSDIVWSGVAWTCGKQLKHYPSFCRNEITIAVHSFVFVKAEQDNHYLAYLEDMYEDRKGQKKVKVRWLHRNQEIKRVISLRNPHPKEVFITPYAQVISVECVDGPAIVLTREHYEKYLADIPSALLARLYLCCRQFKNNRLKPFKLSKLRGYLDQQIFSCLEELNPGDDVKLGANKRTRSCRGSQMLAYESSHQNLKYDRNHKHARPFKVNDKIELLCQDSGIRGCWFRCTVLQISHRQVKIQYDDVKDEDGCGSLEEWVPAFRPAMPDKLGMRCRGRPTIRPVVLHDQRDRNFEVGALVDVWWSDGWWEGVVTRIGNSGYQVFIPSESLLLSTSGKSLRVSRDWMGDHWVDIKANSDILSAIFKVIGLDAKLTETLITVKEPQSNIVEEKQPRLDDLEPSNDVRRDMDLANDEKQPIVVVEEKMLHLTESAPLDEDPRDMESVNDEKPPLVEGTDNNSNHVNDGAEKENVEYIHRSTDVVEDYVDNDDVSDGNDIGENSKELAFEAELLEGVA